MKVLRNLNAAGLACVVFCSVSGASERDVLRGDSGQLARGLQIYNEVCAACHGMGLVRFRDLADPGGPLQSMVAVREIANFYEVSVRAPDGDEVYKMASPSDFIPENPAVNAPDFSLLASGYGWRDIPWSLESPDTVKWRADPEAMAPWWLNSLAEWRRALVTRNTGDANRIEALLLGYTGKEREEAGTILYENVGVRGGWTSMAPPLWGDSVEYQDGTSNSLDQESADVAAFIVWAAEPKVQDRQKLLVHIVLLAGTLLAMLVLTRRRLW